MNETIKNEYLLVIGVACPFILRSIVKKFFKKFYKKIILKFCGCDGKDPFDYVLWKSLDESPVSKKPSAALDSPLIDPVVVDEEELKELEHIRKFMWENSADMVDMDSIYNGKMNWLRARLALGYTPVMAICVAILRLVFWHWMQPAMYCLVLYIYSTEISSLQLIFGILVACREVIYVLLTIMALFTNPSFLLVNLSANWDNEIAWSHLLCNPLRYLIIYVTAPEKFVCYCAFRNPTEDKQCSIFFPVVLVLIFLLDVCGVVALIIAIARNETPISLMIGYGFTALAFLVVIVDVARVLLAIQCFGVPASGSDG